MNENTKKATTVLASASLVTVLGLGLPVTAIADTTDADVTTETVQNDGIANEDLGEVTSSEANVETYVNGEDAPTTDPVEVQEGDELTYEVEIDTDVLSDNVQGVKDQMQETHDSATSEAVEDETVYHTTIAFGQALGTLPTDEPVEWHAYNSASGQETASYSVLAGDTAHVDLDVDITTYLAIPDGMKVGEDGITATVDNDTFVVNGTNIDGDTVAVMLGLNPNLSGDATFTRNDDGSYFMSCEVLDAIQALDDMRLTITGFVVDDAPTDTVLTAHSQLRAHLSASTTQTYDVDTRVCSETYHDEIVSDAVATTCEPVSGTTDASIIVRESEPEPEPEPEPTPEPEPDMTPEPEPTNETETAQPEAEIVPTAETHAEATVEATELPQTGDEIPVGAFVAAGIGIIAAALVMRKVAIR